MEYKFTTSAGFKLLYSLLAVLFVLFLWMWVYSGDISSLLKDTSALILLLFGVIVACLVFINLYRRKVIINNDSVKYVNFWRSKKIAIEYVKGFRFTNTDIHIQSSNKSYASISIKDYFSIRDKRKLIELLNEKFQNLDKQDFESNKHDVLLNTSLELTPQENEIRISQNKRIAKIYSLTGIVLFIGTVIWHPQSIILSFILLLYPLVGIIFMIYSKGLIKLYAQKNSVYSSIIIGLLFAGIALIYQATNGIDIMDYNAVLHPLTNAIIVIFIILVIITLVYQSGKIVSQLFCALLIAIIYALGFVLSINSVFDYSVPNTVQANVLAPERWRNEPVYDLVFVKGKNDFDFATITTHKKFETSSKGAKIINIKVMKGFLGIPWIYYVQ